MNLFFVSLGCDKNLVDSEHMLPLLQKDGYTIVDDEYEADVIVVNTCCFIGDAMEESIQTLIDLGRLKDEGRCKVLLAAGCLAQRYSKEIREDIPEVDGIIGTNGFASIAEAVDKCLKDGKADIIPTLDGIPDTRERLLTTGGHYAYLKIAEGCDKYCTYCVIPYIRGKYRSVPMEALITEAKELADGGVKELILVAQETTLYGTDIYGKKSLCTLLDKLSAIDGIEWIRLLYAYPEEIDDKLIETIKSNPKICHYIDMPIQHCNDRILKLMGRHTTKSDIISVIDKLKSNISDMAIRTTLMCGFPGETDEEAEELVEFAKEMKFDRLGAFMYSKQEGTKAFDMDFQIPEEIKKQRYDRLMSVQQEVSYNKNKALIGTTLRVFIEGKIADEDDLYVGRSYADAPDVDGYVFVSSPYELMSGRMVDVKINKAKEYDLLGDITDK